MARGQRNLSTDTVRLPGFGGVNLAAGVGASDDNGRAPRRREFQFGAGGDTLRRQVVQMSRSPAKTPTNEH